MINSPNATHRFFHFSVWPVRDDERRRSPAALLSVIFISSAHLHFVTYQQCARLLARSGTPPLCCAASRLSLLSAHTTDSPLFLEERMKKGRLTGSTRGWERLEMFTFLSFCPSLTLFASQRLFPAFPSPLFSFFCRFTFVNKHLVMMQLCYLCL